MRDSLSRRIAERPRPHQSARLITAALLLGLATPAAASEGGLVLLPDFKGLLPILVIFFGLLIYPVNALILKPLIQVLDQRSERIEGARGRAERLAREAEDLAARHRDAIREARELAEQQRRQLLDEVRTRVAGELGSARASAESEVERARADLARALDEARRQLTGTAQELAGQVATRILGRPIS